MNRFLIGIVVGISAIAIATPAPAQDAGPRGGKGGGVAAGPGARRGMGMGMRRMHEETMQKLNLTAAQKQKMEALQKKHQDERKKAMSGMKMTPGTPPNDAQRKQMREKLQPMMERQRKEFDAILTQAQREQYKKLIAEEMKKFRERRRDK